MIGMNMIIEGLALGAFNNMYKQTEEPLLKSITFNVMRDESRHVAFGVISLKGYYADMSEGERRDREDFVLEACELMRDRLVGEDIAREFGWKEAEVREVVLASPLMQQFRQLLFMRVVPNIKRLGLLTPRVRQGFSDLQIIQFEDADPEAMDRQLGLA